MSHAIKDKYIEPMVKGEKSHHTRKRDSGYGGTASSDRSSHSHRHTSSRKSNESTNGGSSSRSHAAEATEMNISSQRYDTSILQAALQTANESKERLDKLNYNLSKELSKSEKESQRLRSERDAERIQNDELRVSLRLAAEENDRLRNELATRQQPSRESGGGKSRKSSSKSGGSFSKDSWKEMPVPLYREKTPPPFVPEMTRNNAPPPRPTSSSRATTGGGGRRMSMSHATGTPYATYTVTPMAPANYGPYGTS